MWLEHDSNAKGLAALMLPRQGFLFRGHAGLSVGGFRSEGNEQDNG